MTARIIDGKAAAEQMKLDITHRVDEYRTQHELPPALAVVLVSEDPASQIYVRNKARLAEETGIASVVYRLETDTSESELLELLTRLNGDDAIHGILVQLPLPAHIDAHKVLTHIDPAKDVDGFHPINAGLLATGQPGVVPCTPLGCLHLVRSVRADVAGLDVVIIGRSTIVGRPLSQLFVNQGATVTITNSRTRDLPEHCRRADVLVAAAGHPRLVEGDWIKPGAIVIDVGINRIEDEENGRRIVGDIDFDAAREVAGAITPVPGGVGPMTVAYLLYNTLACARAQRG